MCPPLQLFVRPLHFLFGPLWVMRLVSIVSLSRVCSYFRIDNNQHLKLITFLILIVKLCPSLTFCCIWVFLLSLPTESPSSNKDRCLFFRRNSVHKIDHERSESISLRYHGESKRQTAGKGQLFLFNTNPNLLSCRELSQVIGRHAGHVRCWIRIQALAAAQAL